MAELREVIGGMSRRTLAIVLGVVLVAAGGVASYAASGGFAPSSDASASGSTPPGSSGAIGETTQSDAATASAAGDPSASAPVEPSAEEAVVTFIEGIRPGGGGGGNHSINVHNEEDGRVKIKGSIQLNTITTSNVAPRNSARGWSSCVDCRTLAVAIQINIIDRDATRVAPQNVALAINYQCSHCATVAIALQYTLSVDDPRETPREVEELVRALDKELRRAAHEEDLPAAIAGIEAVIAAYHELREDLDDERDQATETTSPGAVDETPPPSASPSASGSPVSSESSSASPSVAASATPSPSPSVGADPSPSVGASPPP